MFLIFYLDDHESSNFLENVSCYLLDTLVRELGKV
jgi:hypothetical protein